MRKMLFVVAACVLLLTGVAVVAHAGGHQTIPIFENYVYDGNMQRYVDIDMEDLLSKPSVECVRSDYGMQPTEIKERLQIGDWRVRVDWPAASDAKCTILIEHY